MSSLPSPPVTPLPKPEPGQEPPLPPPPPVSSSAAQSNPADGRPLNVTDALSYLDSVKVQFQDKPEVYNRFLDIMKDFKSQTIDTPGVIQRVSKLFHGNPYLIQGFNTFLPQGYRIEISADPADQNTITVTTPSGVTTQNTRSPRHSAPHPREIPAIGTSPQTPSFPAPQPPLPSLGHGTLSRSLTPQSYHAPPQPPPSQPEPPPTTPSASHNTQTTAAASFLGNLNNKNHVEKQPAGEFNHAIQYLNKIKARYADDSNTYKQFLDILQTYQKEQRQIQDVQVYAQVQQLFKDAPDLLAEFKDFLPEVGLQAGAMPPPSLLAPWNASDSSPPDRSRKVAQPGKRKKKIPEKEPTPVPASKAAPSRAKKSKHQHKPDTDSPTFAPAYPVSPPHQQAGPSHLGFGHPANTQSHQPALSLSGATTSATGNTMKLLFFDRAKKILEKSDIYEEFLKLLNLFSKDIIDLKTLVERAKPFLGDSDLMGEFKELVGWDSRKDNPVYGPPGSIRLQAPEPYNHVPTDDGQGPSYRRVAETESRLACSGRDELCRSVLNDHWASNPVWASEEAGFVTHKKNSFEEAIHKSEEERHEFHVHIEALTRTIGVLEPILTRIEEMTNEERNSFRLKPDFGGPGKCIYHRIIKKIYRDQGPEVIQALQDCPSVAVPVVLMRLKQKDEEWKRVQREWSRTWREVDCKNFYKSLDHQGITFKANDKKNITAKYFVGDIEGIKLQQGKGDDSDAAGSQLQLDFNFEDTSVLQDALKMVYSFLDRSTTQYSPLERRSTETFLRSFIPLLFMYPASEFNAGCGPQTLLPEDDTVNDQPESGKSGRRSIGSTHSTNSNGIAAGDLRKQLLRAAQERAEQDHNGDSRANSPFGDILDDETDDMWIQEATARTNNASSDQHRPFFANTTFYTLLRLLQLLYSRLQLCKEEGQNLANTRHASLLANPIAVELGLDDPNGPSTVLDSMVSLKDDSGGNMNVVYMYLLEACEKFFAGDMDQATFEEHMRWFFGNKAYHLFTLDKLIIALIKQVQTVVSDNKCQELLSLLESAQNSERISTQDLIRYRREAERHVGQDDHLYRIEWVKETRHMLIQLMSAEDPTIQTNDRWQAYVDTYVLKQPTEWLSKNPEPGPVFLRRAPRENGKILREGGKLRMRMASNYKLVFELGTTEMLFRPSIDQRLVQRARARDEERERRLNSYLQK